MKKTGRCPKCNETRIGRVPTDRETTAYVCTDCGYMESYLHVKGVDWSLVPDFEFLPRGNEGSYR